MKCNLEFLQQVLVVLAFSVPGVAGETPARPARPPLIVSPETHSDRRVTFRLWAPKAGEVTVVGQWSDGRSAMTRDTNGVWTVTLGPNNPAIKPMRSPRTSILHLPGQPPLIHDLRDVPHGSVRLHTYPSKSLGRAREMVVYTPPGYDVDRDRRYPVLWLQHGMGDNQATWTVHGKAQWILDNLLAERRAQPMLIVMLDGHAAWPGAQGFGNNTEVFERDLIEDAMPFVEANYRVKAGPMYRAIVGLSMGGHQSLTIGLQHTDLFGWVGGFSSAVPSRESVATALDHPDVTNSRLKLLWIACGKNDFLLQRNREFVALLKEKGVRHEWELTAGDHSWPVWRRYLAALAPRLFQS